MIVLDTNVLSALMLRQPDRRVVQWLDDQPADAIWITTITVFEARYGLALLPAGRKRQQLSERFDFLVEHDLRGRVLGVDTRAAGLAAELAAQRCRHGCVVDIRDTLIAGVAMAHGACLATRNTRHFQGLPTPVVDPWDFG